jgi:hypothetical protein
LRLPVPKWPRTQSQGGQDDSEGEIVQYQNR